jgi:hypothetical protein
MRGQKAFIVCSAALFCVTLFHACTESPFDGTVAPSPTKITGQVDLLDTLNDDKGVYVWLSGLNIGTYSDTTGAFSLELPKNVSKDLNGTFTLYFYVANYNLNTAEILIRNGQFLYGFGALTAQGRIKDTIRMFKILDIKTIVDPPIVRRGYAGPIDMLVTLQATVDSVAVIFPKSVGGLVGGIFFRNLQTGQIFIDIPDVGADTRETVMIGREPRSRRQIFQLDGTNFRELFLPVGRYHVIPFFFVAHENLPRELLLSLGEHVEEPTTDYLKIPFRRQEGQFQVIE